MYCGGAWDPYLPTRLMYLPFDFLNHGKNVFVTRTIPMMLTSQTFSNCFIVVSSMSPRKFKPALLTILQNKIPG